MRISTLDYSHLNRVLNNHATYEEEHKNQICNYKTAKKQITTILRKINGHALLSELTFRAHEVGNCFTENHFNVNNTVRLSQPHIETLQGIILYLNTKTLPNKLNQNKRIATKNETKQIQEALIQMTLSYPWLLLPPNTQTLSMQENVIESVKGQLRANTINYRNWGFQEQVEEFSIELYSTFDDKMYPHLGFKMSELIKLFNHLKECLVLYSKAHNVIISTLHRTALKKLNKKYSELTTINIKKINKQFPIASDKSKTKKLNAIKMFSKHLICHYHHFILTEPQIISETLNISHREVESMLNYMCSANLDLNCTNIDKLFLSNPTWYKPIQKTSDQHFTCFTPQTFFSYITPTFENTLSKYYKAELHKERSKYLEKKICEVLKSSLPNAKIENNVSWSYQGKNYETDIIILFDNVIFIIEAKSGKIDPSCSRGSEARLKREVTKLIIKPATQSKLLKDKILSHKLSKEQSLTLKEITINPNKISNIVRLSVTLDDFFTIQSNFSWIKSTNWLQKHKDYEPCPTLSIADLQTVIKILKRPIFIYDYFNKRKIIEENLEYLGDEIDLLGFYIDNLFNFDLSANPPPLVLTNMSAGINYYYTQKDIPFQIDHFPAPLPYVHTFIEGIITQIQNSKIENWIEVSQELLKLSHKEQNDLFKIFQEVKDALTNYREKKEFAYNIIRKTPNYYNDISIFFPIICNETYIFSPFYIEQCFKSSETKRILVIVINIDDKSRSYNELILGKKKDLS